MRVREMCERQRRVDSLGIVGDGFIRPLQLATAQTKKSARFRRGRIYPSRDCPALR
ncbi:MAG: hypothetical protein FWG87_13830 [Defluviitaleaceae bacterium]|nr:hypothetical protein [Defluviitaleaceae bacterium]